MAGDWIKMRGNLWDDPRVSAIVDATDSSEAAIVGGLYWLWATADQHTEDGCMPGLTLRQIDRKTGIKGFGDALVSIGWLSDDAQGVVLKNFTEHNGASAKRRCTDAQRKANVRGLSASDADTTQTDDGQKTPNLGAREEKRREEKKETRNTATSVATPDGVSDELWADFKKLRATKKAPVTQTAIDGISREAALSGLTLSDALAMCCERGWSGFKASWTHQQSNGQPVNKQTALENRNRAVAQRWASGGIMDGVI